ncbi:MAG: glutamine-hydrolyzing GMP synthase, partial [Betaproteobacteria bacterium]|nr:glutamine-hydrolyzing GMP synthase [Betaproteobacteria bacterium]
MSESTRFERESAQYEKQGNLNGFPDHHERLLILDFGSQFTQLIARRARECKVYCEIHPASMGEAAIRSFAPKAIILSGGPNSVYQACTDQAEQVVFELGVPVLGICYGMQVMAQQLGGRVEASDQREFGRATVRARGHSPLLKDIADAVNDEGHGLLHVWMSHGDKVTHLPEGFKLIGSSDSCPIAAMADTSRGFYGLQFHPEVTHTLQGTAIIERFLKQICGFRGDWVMHLVVDEMIHRIREQVAGERVILGLSGGVDSSVAAALIHRAIGNQLQCVFVDTGLLRLAEADQVRQTFAGHFGMQLTSVDASERFMQALAGETDPEKKRKIIGRVFVEVFQEESAKHSDARWLAQGTIYPDVIESAASHAGKASTIKSHHNVGGLPESLQLALLEPLRALFKDEVRALGLELGLPDAMVFRHPFPGPGLGVRILGEVKQEYADLLRRADAIFIETLRDTLDPADGRSWYEKTSQAFAVFLPVKAVGVMGDGRTYEYVVALRAVQTQDFMTADWAELPYSLLKQVSSRIINEVRGINRVTYDVSS